MTDGTKKSKSLFWPAGPLTAKHTKAREGLLRPTAECKQTVWAKSGPPTSEPRMCTSGPARKRLPNGEIDETLTISGDGPRSQRGDALPPLIDGSRPARQAQLAVQSLRRDLNTLARDRNHEVRGLFETPRHPTKLVTPRAGSSSRRIAKAEMAELSSKHSVTVTGANEQSNGKMINGYYTRRDGVYKHARSDATISFDKGCWKLVNKDDMYECKGDCKRVPVGYWRHVSDASKQIQVELDDLSEDELWDNVGCVHECTTHRELRKGALNRLVQTRCLDSVQTARPSSRGSGAMTAR